MSKDQEVLTELCMRLEHFETPEWAVKAILNKEILTQKVIDPCCGAGIISEAAKDKGYNVASIDIHDWKYPKTIVGNFLKTYKSLPDDQTILMNPPFSLAVDFIKKSFEIGARKIVCFQRHSWWESQDRKEFWEEYTPNRIYICGDRAGCWRYDLPRDEKGNRYDIKTGKKLGSSPTAHAWFVFERGHPKGTLTSHIYKSDA